MRGHKMAVMSPKRACRTTAEAHLRGTPTQRNFFFQLSDWRRQGRGGVSGDALSLAVTAQNVSLVLIVSRVMPNFWPVTCGFVSGV